jgi:hypothetical protein
MGIVRASQTAPLLKWRRSEPTLQVTPADYVPLEASVQGASIHFYGTTTFSGDE